MTSNRASRAYAYARCFWDFTTRRVTPCGRHR